jgi:hypothetical protein
MQSCQRKLASRVGLTAEAFQDLESGFGFGILRRSSAYTPVGVRRNDD